MTSDTPGAWEVIDGDCVQAMRAMPDASVESVVCDPPYGLEFMGKGWDRLDGAAVFHDPADVGGFQDGAGGNAYSRSRVRFGRSPGAAMQAWHEAWAVEALRVLKPGGHLLAFGGTRTYHRLACAVEDAGFEVRDCIAWMYGSGFPKSLDVGRAIDKAAGSERVRKAWGEAGPGAIHGGGAGRNARCADCGKLRYDHDACRCARDDGPRTPEAAAWAGWGTALKPAYEPILVARKPLAGTVAETVLAYGTGALNVDGCRVGFAGAADESETKVKNRHGDYGTPQGGNDVYGDYSMLDPRENYDPAGRWPANVALGHGDGCVLVGERRVEAPSGFAGGNVSNTHAALGGGVRVRTDWRPGFADGDGMELVEEWRCQEGCPVRALDEQTKDLHDPGNVGGSPRPGGGYQGGWGDDTEMPATYGDGHGGGAARFFYTAKASRAERNAGLEGFAKRPILWSSGEQNPGSFQGDGTDRAARNFHPTVKPLELMRWLVRLVTPPGGVVLDPFLGSGSTGCAAVLEGFRFVGVEREAEYAAIARARIAFWERARGVPVDRALAGARARRERVEAGQLDLLGELGGEAA